MVDAFLLPVERKYIKSVSMWMMDNIYTRTNSIGNIKSDKEKSTEKNGADAVIMALNRVIRCGNVSAESVYDARGLLFL